MTRVASCSVRTRNWQGRRPVVAALSELGGRAVERILDGLAYGLPV